MRHGTVGRYTLRDDVFRAGIEPELERQLLRVLVQLAHGLPQFHPGAALGTLHRRVIYPGHCGLALFTRDDGLTHHAAAALHHLLHEQLLMLRSHPGLGLSFPFQIFQALLRVAILFARRRWS